MENGIVSSPQSCRSWPRVVPFLLSVLFLFSISSGTEPAHCQETGKRIALVIGNSNYEGMGKLANPVNDAEDMGETLSNLGFDVEVVTDAGLEKMEEAVLHFRDKLAASPGSVGVFFYAGHGVQSGGENYLIPVDARINSESLLRNRAVPLQFILDSLKEANNQVNIVILDACRDNPFSWARSSSRGLAVVGQQPPGSIVVYSTSAGRVAQDGTGRNSVFTEELIQHLQTPGIDITEVLRRTGEAVQSKTGGVQIPAIYSQFFGFLTLAEEQANEEETFVATYLPPFFDEAPWETQYAIALAEQSAQSEQRLSGWNTLMEADPSHANPYFIAAKIRYALQYGKETQDFRQFTFYDTGDSDYDTALQKGTLVQKNVEFDPHSAVQKLKPDPDALPPVLALLLGKYYEQVYRNYPYYAKGWPLSKESVQEQALRWYRVAEKNYLLNGIEEIKGYAELLIEQGKGDEAIAFLRKKIEIYADHDEAERENLWWFLVNSYSITGKPSEAFREIDQRIRQVSSGKAPTELASLYVKGAEIAIAHTRKDDFERYVSGLEKNYPDQQMKGGLLRHRYALRAGDTKTAEALAGRLYQRYPVQTILQENILEGILDNYLLYPEYRKAGIAFLDAQIQNNPKDPRKMFELYMYRAAYLAQTVNRGLTSIQPGVTPSLNQEQAMQILREALSDLNKAEAFYNTLPNQDQEILSIITGVKKEMEQNLGSAEGR